MYLCKNPLHVQFMYVRRRLTIVTPALHFHFSVWTERFFFFSFRYDPFLSVHKTLCLYKHFARVLSFSSDYSLVSFLLFFFLFNHCTFISNIMCAMPCRACALCIYIHYITHFMCIYCSSHPLFLSFHSAYAHSAQTASVWWYEVIRMVLFVPFRRRMHCLHSARIRGHTSMH